MIFVSCEESISEPEEPSVVGKWFTTRGVEDVYILKANSNQTANTYNSIGHLNISGAVTGKLYYLEFIHDPVYGTFLGLDEKTLWDVGQSKYRFVININTKEAELHVNNKYPVPNQSFIGNIDYTFDGTTLIVNPSTLPSSDNDSLTVTISGTISFETVTVPENEFVSITEVPYNRDISTEKEYSIIFKAELIYEFFEDEAGMITISDSSSTRSIDFTYSVDDRTVKSPILSAFIYNTQHYILTEDELIIIGISKIEDLCYYFSDNDECFSHYEKQFNIAQNSLEELQFGAKITLSKL